MLRACLLSGESHYRIGVHTTLDSVLVSARKAIRYDDDDDPVFTRSP